MRRNSQNTGQRTESSTKSQSLNESTIQRSKTIEYFQKNWENEKLHEK